MTDLNNVLEERSIYGSFKAKASWIQATKDSFSSTPQWCELSSAEREALDNIAQKMGRILYGEFHVDNYVDIAGYAQLVVKGD